MQYLKIIIFWTLLWWIAAIITHLVTAQLIELDWSTHVQVFIGCGLLTGFWNAFKHYQNENY